MVNIYYLVNYLLIYHLIKPNFKKSQSLLNLTLLFTERKAIHIKLKIKKKSINKKKCNIFIKVVNFIF